MRKAFFKSQKTVILIVVVDILAVLGIFFFMNHVKFLLNSDVSINLSEIVTQNKDVIASKLATELNAMQQDANQLAEKLVEANTREQAKLDDVFYDYVAKNENLSLIYTRVDGRAISASGKEFKVLDRSYFDLAMQGMPSISQRLQSRENGADVFIFCVPLQYNGEALGVIQKQYTPAEMFSLCSVSLFSEKGTTYIINSQGFVLIGSENSIYEQATTNYYEELALTSPKLAAQLKADINANRSGFMTAEISSQKTFFAYTPIEEIHDWYLISSIPTSTVSPNATIVVYIFYGVLIATALIFTFSLLYFWWLKRKQQQALERLAFVDSVTGGTSFTKFTVELENIICTQDAYPLYICAFDIDNFKYINSFYSYDAGNIILQSIYSRYEERLLPNELIARMTADKFVMLLKDVSAERLERLIELELSIDGIKIYLSAGIYCLPEIPQSVGLMIDKAFMAAHKVKGQHFKHVEHYSDTLDEENAHNEQIKRALEIALQSNEIIAFYQPKVNIYTGELVGAEALARWKSSDGRLIPPNEFIPICEKTGLISLVDMAIFEQTLAFIQKNILNGVHCVPISVNFSRLHLLNENFVTLILQKLEQYAVPPSLIEIELTETVIFENLETIVSFIKTLHRHGLRISMDDFGTGYSSLHMLKDTEIDVLKIDRGFLLDTESSSRQRIIFGAIVQMAKQLQIEVIVEGVETDANVELLKEFGCSNAQGFYYAKPVPSEHFERIFADGKV